MAVSVIFAWFMVCLANASLLEETSWVDPSPLKSAIQDVLLTQNTQDVSILISDDRQDEYATGIVEKVSQSVQKIRPVKMFTNQNENLFAQLSVRSSSRTIFFHVCDTWTVPDDDYLHNLSIVIRNTTMKNHEVKFIMILITAGDGSDNFTTVFEKMWKMQYLHFTIIELVTPDLESEPDSIKVHMYNPFTASCTVQPYQDGIDWFPDKLRDMNGYPFVLNYNNDGPYFRMVNSSAKQNTSCPYDLHGFVGYSVEAMSNILNFTIVVSEDHLRGSTTLVPIPEDGPLDMKFVMGSVKTFDTEAKATMSMMQNKVCLTMPRIHTNASGITPWKVVVCVLIGALVILIFYLCSLAMKFPMYLRHPVNIFGLIIGVGLTKDPSRLVEKIILISLIVASTRYTSIFYAELVSATVLSTPELNIENFDDIQKSGLTAIYYGALYNDTLEETKHKVPYIKPMGLKNSTIRSPLECIRQMRIYRNVTCQLVESISLMAIIMNGERNTKVTPLCTSPLPFHLFFRVNSPYVDYVNPILLRIVESGMPAIWFRNYLYSWKLFSNASYSPHETTSSSDYVPAHLLLAVYSLSVIAFVAEVLWHRWQSKSAIFVRRLTVQPFHIN